MQKEGDGQSKKREKKKTSPLLFSSTGCYSFLSRTYVCSISIFFQRAASQARAQLVRKLAVERDMVNLSCGQIFSFSFSLSSASPIKLFFPIYTTYTSPLGLPLALSPSLPLSLSLFIFNISCSMLCTFLNNLFFILFSPHLDTP